MDDDVSVDFYFRHLTFTEEANSLQRKVSKLERSLSSISTSLNDGALRSLLALTLKIGNYLNYGSNKGSARGFSLDSLTQLRTVKSVDGTTNLLRSEILDWSLFIAETVERQNAHFWIDLRDSIGGAQIAMDVSYDDIVVLSNQLSAKITKVEKEIERIGNSGNVDCDEQPFLNVFSQFVQFSRSELLSVQAATKSIEHKLQTLLKLFAYKGKTPKDGIELVKRLYKFWVELYAAHMENHEKEQRAREQMFRMAKRNLGNQTARPSRPSDTDKLKVPLTARPSKMTDCTYRGSQQIPSQGSSTSSSPQSRGSRPVQPSPNMVIPRSPPSNPSPSRHSTPFQSDTKHPLDLTSSQASTVSTFTSNRNDNWTSRPINGLATVGEFEQSRESSRSIFTSRRAQERNASEWNTFLPTSGVQSNRSHHEDGIPSRNAEKKRLPVCRRRQEEISNELVTFELHANDLQSVSFLKEFHYEEPQQICSTKIRLDQQSVRNPSAQEGRRVPQTLDRSMHKGPEKFPTARPHYSPTARPHYSPTARPHYSPTARPHYSPTDRTANHFVSPNHEESDNQIRRRVLNSLSDEAKRRSSNPYKKISKLFHYS
ncbi:uncharacterized protein C2orf16-like [Condylostylus longicornis]|uniref:uncharacterized protein C2orf16-like n=1 Tax=Condylostylus longicornis TaxID=2530218 RepID=UPI00244DD4CB|nr:uncharacterized protein C2orf16-like [Condylostylus longicornis]